MIKSTFLMRKINLQKRFFSHPNIKIEFTLPELNSRTIEIEPDKKVIDLENEIKKDKSLNKINFKSWDYCDISKENLVSSTFKYPVFMKIDSMEWQILNQPHLNQNQENLKNFNFLTESTFNSIDSKTINDEIEESFKKIFSELDNYNKNNSKSLSSDEIYQAALSVYSLRKQLSEETFNKETSNLQQTLEELSLLKKEIANLNLIKTKLEEKAFKKSKLILLLAPLIFLIELILIYYGTFHLYSWDVTEPMTYLLSCINLIGILYFRKRFGNLSAHEYFTQLIFNRYVKKGKFDLNKLTEAEKKYKILGKKLNL